MQHFLTSAPESNMADIKRQRCSNWSKNETSLLKNLVSDNEAVLNSKYSNSVTNLKKKEVWDEITEQVNLLGVCKRTQTEVKTKWSNIARDLKRDFTSYRKESSKTGGGPGPEIPSQDDQRLLSFMEKTSSFSGIPGGLEVEPSIPEGKGYVFAS